MPRIIFEPLGQSVVVEEGTSLLEAAWRREIPLRSECGGQGSCGQCRVRVAPAASLSPPTDLEVERLTEDRPAQGWRLACQALVQGDLTVTLDQGSLAEGMALGKTGLTGIFAVDPLVRRTALPAARPLAGEERTSLDLAAWLGQRAGRPVLPAEPSAWRALSRPEAAGEVTLVEEEGRGLVALHSGRRERSLGLAVDLGTTTVAGYLCDLTTGQVLAAAGLANPQRRHGEDVISRIAFADQNPDGLDQLSRLARRAVNDLLAELTGRAGAGPPDVDQLCLAGNTTMQQLFLGLHPHALGQAPYLPACRSALTFRAGELGLDLEPGAGVHVFPVLAGFVGGDAVAGLLAVGRSRPGRTTLLIDIGTNGELVLLGDRGAWATSCATGPALEGAHVSCGVRAAPGAVAQVWPGRDGRLIDYRLVAGGGEKALGLCGSGIIDAVATLRRLGLLKATGRLTEGAPGVEVDQGGVGRRVALVPAQESATGAAIALELGDVRQVQLAKAALRVGIDLLLERAGLAKVDLTILTGAFGVGFDWRNAVAIGLLPEVLAQGRVTTMENAAGQGAVLALLDKKRRAEAETLARSVEVVELSQEPGFNLRFALATSFPEPIPEVL